MKNAFHGFISRLDTAKKRISELKNISIKTFKTEMQKYPKTQKGTEHPRTMG